MNSARAGNFGTLYRLRHGSRHIEIVILFDMHSLFNMAVLLLVFLFLSLSLSVFCIAKRKYLDMVRGIYIDLLPRWSLGFQELERLITFS
jgi:hypothetical protein